MPISKGLSSRPNSISSNTKWIKMNAILDDPAEHDYTREYLLTININGIHREFLASESHKGYKVTLKEALTTIEAFEMMMHTENNDFVIDKFNKFLGSLK